MCSQKSNRKLNFGSNRKESIQNDQNYSQKRRNHEQARLMRIKNFPPDFFHSNNNSRNNDKGTTIVN